MFRTAVLTLFIAAGCRAAADVSPAPPAPPAPAAAAVKDAPLELRELRRKIADLATRSDGLKRWAHEALDQGKYDEAATLHRESLEAARQADEIRTAEDGYLRAAARKLIQNLEDDEIAVREDATRELMGLGASAALLRSMATGLSSEAAQRLDLVVRTLEERLSKRQWATGATASTEFNRPSWAATQATGAPNTLAAGDHSTAWASSEQDADSEWLDLTYAEPVVATMVRVHETYNPGAITKVELRDASGAWRTVWEGPAQPADAPRWFEVRVAAEGWTAKQVRLTLDSDAVPGWNEIDAVELVGRDPSLAGPR